MNMFKKNGGFTLVELIVVIAILAILAGIAIPAYSGYIKKANEAADSTALSAVKTAAMATFATKGEVTEIKVVDGDPDTLKVKVGATGTLDALNADDQAVFNTYYGKTFEIDLKSGSQAEWSSATGEWKISGTAE